MAKPNKSLFDAPGFKFDSKSGVLTIKHGGDITIIQEADGSWAYQQGANTYRISSEQASQVNAISVAKATDLTVDPAIYSEVAFSGPGSVKLDAIDYVIADADSKFEPTVNLDTSIKAWIIEDGVAAAFNNLVALTSEADAFKLLWDHLDDEYSYYNTAVNDAFIDLGIIYGQHLIAGGEALNDIVKFEQDSSADLDSVPEREQSLHDNILGNFYEGAIVDRFKEGADEVYDRIEDAGLGALIGEVGNLSDGRPYYGGYDHEDPIPTREFDDNLFFGL